MALLLATAAGVCRNAVATGGVAPIGAIDMHTTCQHAKDSPGIQEGGEEEG